jgi:mono/diheme cytochrome c family protein
MKPAARLLQFVFALSLTLALTAVLSRAAAPDRAALVKRGRYLVENIGLCSDCHTPHNEKGQLVREQLLLGAALPFQPTVPMPWAPVAPPIAGLPSMTEAQAITFLQTGKRPDSTQPRPPMPEFRLDEADATAVTAYLKSLAK